MAQLSDRSTTASAPVASTSKAVLSDHLEPPSSQSPRALSDSTTRRSISKASTRSPLLPDDLRSHDFVLPAMTSSALGCSSATNDNPYDTSMIHGQALEAKHVGAGALKRIFIGPHRVDGPSQSGGVSDSGARTTKPQPREQDEQSSDSSEDDSDMDDDINEATKRENKESRRARYASGWNKDRNTSETSRSKGKDRNRIPTGETIRGGTMKPTGSRKSSIHQWVGGSFEIGRDIRDAAKRRDEARSRARPTSEALEEASTTRTTTVQAPETFVTARTHLNPTFKVPTADYMLKQPSPELEDNLPPDLAHALLRRSSDPLLEETASLSAVPDLTELPSESTLVAQRDTKGILRTRAHASLGHGHPSTNSHTFPDETQLVDEFGRPKSIQSLPVPKPARMESTVRFSQPLLDRPLAGDEPPKPVEDVLARPDQNSRADEEAAEVPKPKRPRKNDVLRKERMLVKVEWTAREDLPDEFDENAARKFPTTGEGWEEYGVVWRPGRVELWSEYTVSAASFFLGHKKLNHIIPLAPARTKLSLYSSPDIVFCLTWKPEGQSLIGGAAAHVTRQKKNGRGNDEAPNASKATRTRYIHRRTGTYVFIFRTRSQSIAKEWMWELFRGLGKSLPDRLEITVPELGARIHLPMPTALQVAAIGSGRGTNAHQAGISESGDKSEEQGWRFCKPQNVIEACLEQLKLVTEWQSLLVDRKANELKLCWRRENTLDWVDMFGKGEADWALVCGFSLRQSHHEPVLELRLGLHYPTTVRVPATKTKDAHRLAEPPAIEGYVARLRPNGSSERIYLSTHDGHLFICPPSTCHPPEPPIEAHAMTLNPAVLVLAPFALGWGAAITTSERKRDQLWERVSRSASGATGFTSARDLKKRDRALKAIAAENEDEGTSLAKTDWIGKLALFEKQRALEQMLDAKGYVDLRDIAQVGGIEDADSVRGEEWGSAENDVGGEEGLVAAKDRAILTKRRTFIMETKTGITARFECYSIAVRDEWIGRLNALINYWCRRERIDAIEQMQLHPGAILSRRSQKLEQLRRYAGTLSEGLYAGAGGSRPESPEPRGQDRDNDDEMEELATRHGALLTQAFNWCVLEGCRAILRCGRFYIKRGLRGQFKERYLILLSGTLVIYQTHKRDMHGQIVPTSYHRRKRTISLRNCYIYSGRLTSPMLAVTNGSAESWDPADSLNRFPRIYSGSDGLRVNDEEEDCTLVIFKRSGSTGGKEARFGRQGTNYVLRSRSRIERDEWVFALNAAIEKLHHAEKEREDRLREFAWLQKSK